MSEDQKPDEHSSWVYARVIVMDHLICSECKNPIIPGGEGRLKLWTGTSVQGHGVLCLRCFGQIPRGQQIPESMLR